ncbi:actin cytoskeleton and mitosis protein [Thecaphora frezii]
MRPLSNRPPRPSGLSQQPAPTDSIHGAPFRPTPKRISPVLGRGSSNRPRPPPAASAAAAASNAASAPGAIASRRAAGAGPRIIRPHAPSGGPQATRPRPFANKSTIFNKPATAAAPAAPAPATAPAASSPAPARPTTISAAQINGSPAAATDGSNHNAFGMTATAAPSAMPAASAFFKPAFSTSALPSASSSGAFTTAPAQAASPFGSDRPASAFSAFGSPAHSTPDALQPAAVAEPWPLSLTAASSPSLAPNPGPAPAAASSLSSFLRKDKPNTSSTASSRASTPLAGNSAFSQGNTLGGSSNADEDEERKKRFEDAPKSSNRFLEMKGQREALRASYIASGILPDPNKPTDLALAIKLTGTCQDMCPEFEREEREFQKELDRFEVYPGTSRVDPKLAVKIYRRPAAGRELPLPEDVRPPAVLKKTLDYLLHDLLPASPNDPAFTAVQPFLWNRTRAIRQDFIVQSESGLTTIECHERIARYHILCLHWKGGPGAEAWSEQQELEQLRKTLRSLIEFYDDRRRSGHTSPNEAEFRAYNLVLHLRDPETLREVELLPRFLFVAPQVQTALSLRALAQRSNNLERRGQPRNTEATLNFFSRFFAEVRKPTVSYLMACLAENTFNSVRVGAIKAMSKAYMAQHRPLPLDFLVKCLGLDGEDQAIELVQHLGLELDHEEMDGVNRAVGVKLAKTSVINEEKPIPSPFSANIVEAKRGGFTNQDIVDGVASGSAPPLPPFHEAVAKTTGAPAPAPASVGTFQPGSAFGAPQTPKAASAFQVSPSFATGSTYAFGGATAFSSAFRTNAHAQAGASTSSKLSATAVAFVPSNVSKSSQSAPSTKSGTAQNVEVGSFTPATAASQLEAPTSVGPALSFGRSTDHSVGSIAPPSSGAFSTTAFQSQAPKRKTSDGAPKAAIFDKPVSFSASPTRNWDHPTKTPATGPEAAVASTSESLPKTKTPFTIDTPRGNGIDTLPEPAKKKRRKIPETNKAELVERAFTALLQPLVNDTAKNAATAAVETERTRRQRLEARSALLDAVSLGLFEHMAGERCTTVSCRQAKQAIATAFEERTSKRFGLESWKIALKERRQRREMKARLELIRFELKQRGLGGGSERASSVALGERRVLKRLKAMSRPRVHARAAPGAQYQADDDNDDDITLRTSFLTAQQRRQALWEEGAFLEQIAQKLECIVQRFCPVQLERFSTLFFGVGDDGGVASRWLRAKFGLLSPMDDQVEVALSDGTFLELIDASKEGDDRQDSDIGLVVFECDPRAVHATADQRERIWSGDRARLERIASSQAIRESAFAQRLLVVAWSDGATPSQSQQQRQAETFSRLGLGPHGTSTTTIWDRTAVLELGDADRDATAEMAHKLRHLLPTLAWNPRFRRVTLAQLTAPLSAVWTDAVSRIAALLTRLPTETASVHDAARSERKALRILIALANHVVKVAMHLSETILEPEEESEVLLPASEIDDGSLYACAHQVIEHMALRAMEREEDDADETMAALSHVQTALLAGEAQGESLSLCHLLPPLFTLVLTRLEAVWISVTDESTVMTDLQHSVEEMQDLASRAIDEMADEVRDVCRRSHLFSRNDDRLGTKRSVPDVHEDKTGVDADRPMTLDDLADPPTRKRTKSMHPASLANHASLAITEEASSYSPHKESHPATNGTDTTPTPLDELRALIDRTTRFLDSTSSS